MICGSYECIEKRSVMHKTLVCAHQNVFDLTEETSLLLLALFSCVLLLLLLVTVCCALEMLCCGVRCLYATLYYRTYYHNYCFC